MQLIIHIDNRPEKLALNDYISLKNNQNIYNTLAIVELQKYSTKTVSFPFSEEIPMENLE